MSEPVTAVYFVNDKFVPASEALISATDLAVLRGYGVFDSLRTYAGKPFRLEEHLERLENSAHLIGLDLPWSRAEVGDIIQAVLDRCPFPESSVRIVVTGGESANFFTPEGKSALVVIGTPLPTYPDHYYKRGIQVATTHLERHLPLAKTTSYMPGQVAIRQARARFPEVVEVLYVNRSGLVTEGVTSNVFAFQAGCLITPGMDILQGVTRQVVLELAEGLFPLDIRPLRLEELYRSDEVFITGSAKEIMPVALIDDQAVKGPVPGANTVRLRRVFRDMVNDWVQERA